MPESKLLFLAPARAISGIFGDLRDAGYELGMADSLEGALSSIQKTRPAAIFSRPQLPGGYTAEELLAKAAEDENFPPVVIIAENGTADEAESLMNQGARDYWLEPLDMRKIEALLAERPRQRSVPPHTTLGGHKPEPAPGAPAFNIVGDNPAIRRVLRLAGQVAPSKATVLITGDSGTGKEMFARYLHSMSRRSKGPFVAVNCAALPEHLLESELFGHEKGAFTGAIARKPGKFELASGGTILLDEISEMDLALQAKLLRVLQEGEIDRVGGSETVSVDVRVLATTNRDLEDWVRQGKFRQDLYFRLNVIPLRLPSLRERGNDILTLARFFIDIYTREYGIANSGLSRAASDWLMKYEFPGNVRELQNLMERAVLLANGKPIEPAHFLLENSEWPLFEDEPDESDAADGENDEAPQQCSPSVPQGGSDYSGPVIPLHEMERIMIVKGLAQTSGNRTQAAELLGISVRTLRNKLNEYRAMGRPVD